MLESSRRIAHDLLPPALDKFGLVAALEELCDQIESGGQHRIQSKFSYTANTLTKNDELHVFRMVQELINNSLKYANANTIQLSLENKTDTLQLQYTDNGVGFVVAEGKLAKGLGLSGIENRAILIDSDYTLESEPGGGMHFTLTKKLT